MKSFFCLTISLCYLTVLTAQQKAVSHSELDTIFTAYEEADVPGLAAGIVKNDHTFYLKGVGLANLEHQIAITPQTKFQIDELSKQFTTLAVLILEQQGKISMDDPVQNYIKSLPRYPSQLTIAHVLNHSTGLNDYTVVKSLLGQSNTETFSTEDALALIQKQSRLNFIPGTDFSYFTSDTESLLMALIIAKASGQSFAAFTKTYIFEPLGMKNTLFSENHELLIKNKAASYRMVDEQIVKNTIEVSTAGPTNLFTTAEDLAIWYQQFHKKTGKLASLIHKLNTPVALTNGTTYDSYWGRMTLGRDFFHYERGMECYWHFGIVGGYAANVFRFPKQELVSFVIGNNMQYNGAPAMQMAEHFMQDLYPEPPFIDMGALKLKKVSQKKLKTYEGYYWYPKRGLTRKITLKNDTLRLSAANGNYETPLLPLSKTKFQLAVDSDDKIFLDFQPISAGEKRYQFLSGIAHPKYYVAYTPKEYSTEELKQFSGTFYNKDLNVEYHFKIDGGSLKTTHQIPGDVALQPVMEDLFSTNFLTLATIQFQRNGQNKIDGFTIITDGLRQVYFTKKETSL